ncbi:hypothetical protein I7I53_11382 [Histoplasma capsulatum var. duboisii H88]|uniref:Uncharacterized protein n=1 Tax=Ajellomyces capsulatus (strain H88) TaxID=544711 RepID=A0A8A1LDW3_AJEC8|nr:hypothetical protein I7I53_11382 [Histoplasma capsulatum var. duboisii H88]
MHCVLSPTSAAATLRYAFSCLEGGLQRWSIFVCKSLFFCFFWNRNLFHLNSSRKDKNKTVHIQIARELPALIMHAAISERIRVAQCMSRNVGHILHRKIVGSCVEEQCHGL